MQGITMEAYAPLTRGKKLKHKVVAGIAKEVGKTPAQVGVAAHAAEATGGNAESTRAHV